MTHGEFVAGYSSGEVRIDIDRAAASRFMTRRLLLPFVMMPVLGIGTALALTGWLWTGLTLITVGTIVPIIIKRSAPHFIVTQALQDVGFYEDVVKAGVLQIQKHLPQTDTDVERDGHGR